MSKRIDPHRPSALNPADYVFVGAADTHPGATWMTINRKRLREYGVEVGNSGYEKVPFYDARPDGRPNYRCHHCGKHGSGIHYFCFFLHKPTKEVVVFGQICAKKAKLGSKEELDFQKSVGYRKQAKLIAWIKDYQAEYDYLREYAEAKWFAEFLDSLWTKLSEFGSLTERQVEGLRKWMERGKPWETKPQMTLGGDRHKGEVTQTEDEPTPPQLELIEKLAKELESPYDMPETRLDASDLINTMKAALTMSRSMESPKATERQKTLINGLMEERIIPQSARREARQIFDDGLTKAQASRWIEKLLTLPKVRD